MTRTLTALFDSRADAEAGKARLKAASIDVDHVQLYDKGSADVSSNAYSTQQDRGFWASLKGMFLPDEDRHTYEEGIRRGGCVLAAEVSEKDADKAVKILEEANSIDIDQRSSEWRQDGWDYPPAGAGTGSAFAFGGGKDRADNGSEQRIPIVEEQLRVGKREVDRGGVRVRSYVVEEPVKEQVALREEHVSVERRPVDQPISAKDDDAFRERTIEMTETAEEAVAAKEARVKEELVVRKDVDERVETVEDTVRHTEIDFEEAGERKR